MAGVAVQLRKPFVVIVARHHAPTGLSPAGALARFWHAYHSAANPGCRRLKTRCLHAHRLGEHGIIVLTLLSIKFRGMVQFDADVGAT